MALRERIRWRGISLLVDRWGPYSYQSTHSPLMPCHLINFLESQFWVSLELLFWLWRIIFDMLFDSLEKGYFVAHCLVVEIIWICIIGRVQYWLLVKKWKWTRYFWYLEFKDISFFYVKREFCIVYGWQTKFDSY